MHKFAAFDCVDFLYVRVARTYKEASDGPHEVAHVANVVVPVADQLSVDDEPRVEEAVREDKDDAAQPQVHEKVGPLDVDRLSRRM